MQIQFGSEEKSRAIVHAPTYVGNEYITGTATFNLREDYEGMRYKIAVKGAWI